MKTTAMPHQLVAVDKLANASPTSAEYYALACEQGTGKTFMCLADAEQQYLAGEIDAVLVVAPKGVHLNWINREIPTHMSIDHVTGYWRSPSPKYHQRQLDALLKRDTMIDLELIVFAINIDAINGSKGYDYVEEFLKTHRTMMIVDESHLIKSHKSKRTHKLVKLGKMAVSRRVGSGTMIANGPIDVFYQYEFLKPGLLGTRSYSAFVAEYAVLHTENSNLYKEAKKRNPYGEPQIIRTDVRGRPMFKNLDKLAALMAPHTYRLTKEECLDLPPKVFQTLDYEMVPAHKKQYDKIKSEMRYMRDDGTLDTYTALTMVNKLRQITSGFIMADGEPIELIDEHAEPRMKMLDAFIEGGIGQMIIWGTFREELRRIMERLEYHGKRDCVLYQGGVKDVDRENAVDSFQSGNAEFFISNPAAGGTGLTLTAAERVAYYSCDFSLIKRLQSEDRCHRIGTTKSIVYADIVAVDTIDVRIAAVLQAKAETADDVMSLLD